MPPFSLYSIALCKYSRKAELYLENFSLDNREIVELRQWRNWRKQKIRRAVNKSTQKLILLVPVGALSCCTPYFLPENPMTTRERRRGNGKVKLYLSTTTTTGYLSNSSKFKPQPRKHKININRGERKFSSGKPPTAAAAGCTMDGKNPSGWEIPAGKVSLLLLLQQTVMPSSIDLNRSSFLMADFGSQRRGCALCSRVYNPRDL